MEIINLGLMDIEKKDLLKSVIPQAIKEVFDVRVNTLDISTTFLKNDYLLKEEIYDRFKKYSSALILTDRPVRKIARDYPYLITDFVKGVSIEDKIGFVSTKNLNDDINNIIVLSLQGIGQMFGLSYHNRKNKQNKEYCFMREKPGKESWEEYSSKTSFYPCNKCENFLNK